MVQCLAEERLKIGQRPEAARSVMGVYFERMKEIARAVAPMSR